MHISIPNATEISVDIEKKKYVLFNIHIDGTYHCSARYSTLADLFTGLKKQFGAACVGHFPAKSMFYTSPASDDGIYRRLALQRWFQNIAHQRIIIESATFQTFLLNAQSEVKNAEENVVLEIFLANGKGFNVKILSTDQHEDVLEAACTSLGVPPELTYFFALYLVDLADVANVIRRINDFECPWISLQRTPNHRIQIRRAYFDPVMEPPLLANDTCCNLLFFQALSEVKSGSIRVPPTQAKLLGDLRAAQRRQDFLAATHKMEGYCAISIGFAISDFPQAGTEVKCFVDKNGLVCREIKDAVVHTFSILKMRSWATYDRPETGSVELVLEYNMEEKGLITIKMESSVVIFLAVCLKNLVEERIRLDAKKMIRRPSDRKGKFKPRRVLDSGSSASLAVLGIGVNTEVEEVKKPTARVSLSELLSRVSVDDDEGKDLKNVKPDDRGLSSKPSSQSSLPTPAPIPAQRSSSVQSNSSHTGSFAKKDTGVSLRAALKANESSDEED